MHMPIIHFHLPVRPRVVSSLARFHSSWNGGLDPGMGLEFHSNCSIRAADDPGLPFYALYQALGNVKVT